MNEKSEKKNKWYRFTKSSKRKPKAEVNDDAEPIKNKDLPPASNSSNGKIPESKITPVPRVMQNPQPFKNIPFKLRLSKRSNSLDDIYLRSAQMKGNSKETAVVLFIRSILPDLSRMNAEQMHQFRMRTLSTIGSILYKDPSRSMRRSGKVKFKNNKSLQESMVSSEDQTDRSEYVNGSESDFSSAESATD